MVNKKLYSKFRNYNNKNKIIHKKNIFDLHNGNGKINNILIIFKEKFKKYYYFTKKVKNDNGNL